MGMQGPGISPERLRQYSDDIWCATASSPSFFQAASRLDSSMFVSIFFVNRPDYEKAEALDNSYREKVLKFCPEVISKRTDVGMWRPTEKDDTDL